MPAIWKSLLECQACLNAVTKNSFFHVEAHVLVLFLWQIQQKNNWTVITEAGLHYELLIGRFHV